MIQNTECTVPLSKLITEPFNLLKGYGIYIKVIAINSYGDSLVSDPGNSGIIVLVPDAPEGLTNNPDVTTNSVLSFTWVDAENDGGTSVLDYKITYD